ncbi:MAG: flavodoxin family protein [Dehalococcoidia bacterium]|nr:MAG: flavodoxin family protein [Dehalococcoidia bacterium]
MIMTISIPAQEELEALDEVLKRVAPIMRPRWQEKMSYLLNLTKQARGVKTLNREDVIKAAIFVSHPSPKWHENTAYYRERHGYKAKKDNYYAAPRRVKRWDSTATKPKRPPGEMKVLAFNSSPRKGGNTDVLIDEALRGAQAAGAQTEKYMLHYLNIKYCIGCRKCKEPNFKKICVLKDDMTDFIYQKIFDADIIVIGLPIYTGREPAQLATFFDRLDCMRRFDINKDLKTPTKLIRRGDKTAMVICTWGVITDKVDVYDHIIDRMIVLLNGHRIETVEALSACGFSGMLHGFDDDHKAIILRYPDEMKKAYEAGKALILGK